MSCKILKSISWVFLPVGIIFLVSCVAFMTLFKFYPPSKEDPLTYSSTAEILELYDVLKIGLSKSEVFKTYGELNFDTLYLAEYQDGKTVINTPDRWGARNWRLLLEFDGGNQLSGVKVRSADNLIYQPNGAPPDKIEIGLVDSRYP